MDLDRLVTFVDACRSLNFTETAKSLKISQPTVSKHIRALESELKVTLFDRAGGKLRLTHAGQALLPWARQIVRECQKFHDMAASLQDRVSGDVSIACTTSSGRHLLPVLAAKYRWKFPDVQVKILIMDPGRGIALVRSHSVDFAVLSSEVQADGLESQFFFTDEIILVAPAGHRWTAVESIEPDDILGEPIILREPTSGTRQALKSALAEYDISIEDLDVLLEIGNADGIVSAVSNGLGVAFVSKAASKCALNMGQIRHVPIKGIRMSRQVYMVRTSSRLPSRAAALFWGFAREKENLDLF